MKGGIYCICSKDVNSTDLYIGSSANIPVRTHYHIYVDYFRTRNKSNKLYRTIRESGGFDNWKIVTLEYVDDIGDLEDRERYWYYSLKPNLNGVVPARHDSRRLKNRPVKRKRRKRTTIYMDI